MTTQPSKSDFYYLTFQFVLYGRFDGSSITEFTPVLCSNILDYTTSCDSCDYIPVKTNDKPKFVKEEPSIDSK